MTATLIELVDAHGSRFERRSVQVTVTFTAASPDSASTTVTGLPWVSADTGFVTSFVGTALRSAMEPLIEGCECAIDNVVPGVGFDVIVTSPNPGGSTGSVTVHVAGV